jgi:hypothetical protein
VRSAPLFAVAVAIAALATPPLAAAAGGFTPMEVTARPLDAFRIEPGSLVEYRGGLVLASRERAFGSWSGIDFASDGTLYAIADDGYWMSLRLIEADGRLTGIAMPRIAPLLDDAGRQVTRKDGADGEGLRIVQRNGADVALVSFEQTADVRAFAGPDFATAQPRHLPLPRELNALYDNLGLEAIAVAPLNGPLAGATVVLAEEFLDKNGNHRGFILDGPLPGWFTLRRTDDFDVSDAVFLPDGDLLVLERKFGLFSGFSVRIRRIPGASVAPGALLDGWTMLQADAQSGIDNMEGIAVRIEADGTALVTLIADDNHSFLQRTILLEFAVKPLPVPTPRLRPTLAAG